MNNVAVLKKSQQVRPVCLSYGRVVEQDGELHGVMPEGGAVVWARKADGCLVTPEVGDLVLVAEGGKEGPFVLSVIMKGRAESRLVLNGEVEVQAESFVLKARGRVGVEAPEIAFTGVRGEARFLTFAFLVGVCKAEIQKVTTVIQSLDSVTDRLTQRIRNSFRWVENLEQVHAGRIRSIVKQRFSIKARHVSVQAEEEVTVDGRKVLLG
jgi:hypothetical protein